MNENIKNIEFMLDSVDIVFNSNHLRREIIYHIAKSKYHDDIKTLVWEAIINKWFLYCPCEQCVTKFRYMGM